MAIPQVWKQRALWLCCLVCWSVSAPPAEAQEVEPAPEYEQTFRRETDWTGADGTYSYPLPNGQILWGFSDTFFGEVKEGARQEPWQFRHNSMVLQGGSTFVFLPAPVFEPPNEEHWFWVWDAAGGDRILLGEFRGSGDNDFNFEQAGLWTARFRLADGDLRIEVSELTQLPFFEKRGDGQITFGPAILETAEWLYLYGVLDRAGERHSVLARTPVGALQDPEQWRFFDGQQWRPEMESAQSLFPGAAMEASVHRTASGEYLYVGTDAGGMGERIIARRAPAPEGPWSEPILVHTAPEHQGDVFTYNAKAHPELSGEGRLLISYNVNTRDLNQVVADADIYRPRFFWWTPPELGWLPERWR
jgi:hypothetical protein